MPDLVHCSLLVLAFILLDVEDGDDDAVNENTFSTSTLMQITIMMKIQVRAILDTVFVSSLREQDDGLVWCAPLDRQTG